MRKTRKRLKMSKTRKALIKKRLKALMATQATQATQATPLKKNLPLEKFWQSLSSGEKVVLVFKDGSQKMFKMSPMKTKKRLDEFGSVLSNFTSTLWFNVLQTFGLEDEVKLERTLTLI